jgi:hypothetical protein
LKRGRCRRCLKSYQRAKDQRRGSASQRGYGKQWHKLRAAAIAVQPWCALCHHPGSKDNPLSADHIVAGLPIGPFGRVEQPMARTILSITAAPGWSAKAPDQDYGEEQFFTLVAWALVEKDSGEREIVGLVQRGANDDVAPGSFAFADEAINGFSGYSFQGLKTRIG